jgi:PHD/YefM family antitoxin component YafN of YafNO toxin-antitoxin module
MTSVSFRDRRRLAAVHKAALQTPVVCERHRKPRIVIVAVEEYARLKLRRDDPHGYDTSDPNWMSQMIDALSGIRTLLHRGANFDEAHFVGSHEKAPLLWVTGAQICFDDRDANVIEASGSVPAGLVHSNPQSRGCADRYSRQTRDLGLSRITHPHPLNEPVTLTDCRGQNTCGQFSEPRPRVRPTSDQRDK